MFILLFLTALSTLAQAKPAQEVKIEVQQSGRTTTSISLPDNSLKVRAGEAVFTNTGYETTGGIRYDQTSGKMTLTHHCFITVIQGERPLLRFEGDKAIVEAEDVEIQVDGGFPSSFPSFPLDRLLDTLQIDPKFHLFRVNWSFGASGFISYGTTLYDRKNQTLREYRIEGHSEFGNIGKIHIYTQV